MRVLLLSAILYLTGVALVLFLRPRLMFTEDGRWKEFGSGVPDRTIFPFWLFCVLWGALSYMITNLFVQEGGSTVDVVATAAATTTLPFTTTRPEDDDALMPLPPKTRGRNHNAIAAEVAEGNMKPGYYILDPKGSGIAGVPKYIYIGPEPSDAVDDRSE